MFLHKKYPASEPHFVCDDCSEAVINPICPFCLTTEIEAWLTLYPNLREELLPKIHKDLMDIEDKMVESTECIRCGKNTTAVCPYCFTKQVLYELRKIQANRIIMKEFFQFFNFDFHHTGYTKEAEELGVI